VQPAEVPEHVSRQTIKKDNIAKFATEAGHGMSLLAKISAGGMMPKRPQAQVTHEGQGQRVVHTATRDEDVEREREELKRETGGKQKTLLTMIAPPSGQDYRAVLKSRGGSVTVGAAVNTSDTAHGEQSAQSAAQPLKILPPPTNTAVTPKRGTAAPKAGSAPTTPSAPIDYRAVLKKSTPDKSAEVKAREERDREEKARVERETAEREKQAREEKERETKAREEQERRAREELEQQARAEQERAQHAREEQERVERETKERAAQEEQARLERERLEREAKAREAQEAAEKLQQEEQARAQQQRAEEERVVALLEEQRAKQQREDEERAEEERKRHETLEQTKLREESERQQREEEARKREEELARVAQETQAREEQERLEREVKEREEQERRAREEQELEAQEKQAREEQERRAREELEQQAREKQAREEQEREAQEKQAREAKEREEQERRVREEHETQTRRAAEEQRLAEQRVAQEKQAREEKERAESAVKHDTPTKSLPRDNSFTSDEARARREAELAETLRIEEQIKQRAEQLKSQSPRRDNSTVSANNVPALNLGHAPTSPRTGGTKPSPREFKPATPRSANILSRVNIFETLVKKAHEEQQVAALSPRKTSPRPPTAAVTPRAPLNKAGSTFTNRPPTQSFRSIVTTPLVNPHVTPAVSSSGYVVSESATGTYSYEELVRRPANLERSHLEAYLSDEDFERVFKVKRDVFNAWPKWKQTKSKQELALF
jgi:hypothetical protein